MTNMVCLLALLPLICCVLAAPPVVENDPFYKYGTVAQHYSSTACGGKVPYILEWQYDGVFEQPANGGHNGSVRITFSNVQARLSELVHQTEAIIPCSFEIALSREYPSAIIRYKHAGEEGNDSSYLSFHRPSFQFGEKYRLIVRLHLDTPEYKYSFQFLYVDLQTLEEIPFFGYGAKESDRLLPMPDYFGMEGRWGLSGTRVKYICYA